MLGLGAALLLLRGNLMTLHDAVEAFRKDKLICDTLGEHIVSQYVAGKEKEWDSYRTHVSNWEIEKYLVTY